MIFFYFYRTIMIGAGFLEGNWETFKEQSAKVHLIEPVLEGVLQMFFQYIILYIIYGPGTSMTQSKPISYFDFNAESDFRFLLNLDRPLDLSSLLSSSNDSIPYSYFILLSSTVISVGVSFGRILTKGKNPVLTNIISFKFVKVILMIILKLMIQSFILSMALKSLMYKFVSKGRNIYLKRVSEFTFFSIFSINIFHTHHMTLRVTESLKRIGTEDFVSLMEILAIFGL